jgi:hypothetical protein
MSKAIEEDLPSIGNMLVSIDSAARTDHVELQNTMEALLLRAAADDVAQEEYLKLAILVAFRRRNHLKSMAVGVGGGERLIMLTILRAVSSVAPNLVVRILPLVPLYGSWRDVRLLGDMVYGKQGAEEQVRAAVATLFAGQLRRDLESAGLSLDGKALEPDNSNNKKRNISLACKYAPSSSRHRGSKKTREHKDSGNEESGVRSDGGFVGRPVGRGGKGGKGGRGRGGKGSRGTRGVGGGGSGGGLFSPEAAAESREENHASQSAMADEVASALGLRPTHLKADLRKLVVSPLNNILTEEGYLIERLMVERRCAEIRFRRAGKSALAKYKEAINKDPVANRRWKALMATSAAAVPDIEDLFFAAQSFLDCPRNGDEDEVALGQRAISKAIYEASEERSRLKKKAQGMLAQLSKEEDTGEAIKEAAVALNEVEVPCLAVVDLGTSNSRQHATAMILASFIMMRSQERSGLIPLGSSSVLIHFNNGHQRLVSIPYTSPPEEEEEVGEDKMDEDNKTGAAAAEEETTPTEPASSKLDGIDFGLFFDAVEEVGQIAHSDNTPFNVECLKNGARMTLNHHLGRQESSSSAAAAASPVEYGDILVLCGNFPVSQDAELESNLQSLKEQVSGGDGLLRALLVHRVKPSSIKSYEDNIVVPFVPRKLRPIPSNASEIEVDICFLMDLTASMGSWIDACKTHLKNIINELKGETNVGKIRIGYVGYRDYRDPDRIVSIQFHEMENVQKVISFIASEGASGGADEPEDVVKGLQEVVDKMEWKGHIRMCIHVADATGHGLTQSLSYSNDDYPNGTPDQTETTQEVCSRLANNITGPGVDMLFCQLNNRTIDLENVYSNIWSGGEGFGILPIRQGAGAFKQAIMSTLTSSLLGLIANPEMSSVQTFDGSTLSATFSAMNANYKESLQSAGSALATLAKKKLQAKAEAAAAEAVSTKEEDEEFVVVEKEEEEGETTSRMKDVDEVTTEAVTEVVDEKVAAEETVTQEEEPAGAGGGEKGDEKEEARGDIARLMMDLEGEDLTPVRIALQMTPGHGGMMGLDENAAKILMEGGVTLSELSSLEYPASILDVFTKVGEDMVRRVA